MGKLKEIIRIGDAVFGNRLGRIEPQKSYMFDLAFYDHNTVVPSFGEIRFNVKSVTIPNKSKEVVERHFLNAKMQYAGKDSSEKKVTVVFWDDEGGSVQNFIRKWYSLSSEESTYDSLDKSYYIKDMKVNLKDTSDLLITKSFLFKNVFPSDIGEISLTYDNSDILEITVTFAFDDVVVLPPRNANSDRLEELKGAIDNFTDSVSDAYSSLKDLF